MSTNTQGGYRIGTVKGRKLSEDRAMSDLIDRAALRTAVNRIPLWSPHPDIKDSVSGKWTMAANDVLDAIEGAAPRAATEPPPTFDTPLYRKAVLDVVKRWDMGPEAAAEVIEALDRARRSHVHTPKWKPGAANAFCDSCGFFPLATPPSAPLETE